MKRYDSFYSSYLVTFGWADRLCQVVFLLVSDERVRLRVTVAEQTPEDEPDDAQCPEHVEHTRPAPVLYDDGS